jgi:hypothetical protein
LLKTLLSKEQGLFSVKRGIDAKQGEVNAAIYHQSRSKNWKKVQDVPKGLRKMKATVMMKAATTMNLKAKHLKQVTIYIRIIKITKTPRRYALRSRPY